MSTPPSSDLPPHITSVTGSSRHPPCALRSTSTRYSHHLPTLKLIHSLVGQQCRAYDKLERLCVDYGHRIAGSEQLERVIDWLLHVMKHEEGGLERVYTQDVIVPQWQRGHAYAYILDPLTHTATSPPQPQPNSHRHHSHHPHEHSGGIRPLHILSIGLSKPTPPDGITAPVVLISSFEHLAALVAADANCLRGKIAFYNHPFTSYADAVPYRSKGAVTAEQHGAVAVLVRSVCPVSLSTPHTGNQQDSTISAACITIEDAELLSRMLQRHSEVSVHLFSSASSLPWRPSRNVIAELRGREKPDEVVVLGAHIDSWDVGQGAQDDGQGCMAAWEALRILSSSPALRPRRTLRLVLFTDEENRGSGAKEYLQQTEDEVSAGRVVAAMETDVGCWDAVGFGLTGTAAAKAVLCEMAAPLRDWGWDSVCDDGDGVDIRPLIQRGVPGLLLRLDESWWTHDYFAFHHTDADTIDKVDRDKLTANTQLLAMMAWTLAEAEETLPTLPPTTAPQQPAAPQPQSRSC